MHDRLHGKWVLITGASSGFGAAAARAFGAVGSRLLLGARRLERLEQVAATARAAGALEAHVHPLDVTNTSSVESFFHWARNRLGTGTTSAAPLHVLINNAGGALGLDPVLAGRVEDWETMFQTNVLGLLRVTRAALPLMLGNPGGVIINIGSVAGHEAYEGGAAYCGAKAAEHQITRVLRLELCGSGVRVCTLDPGMAQTEFSLVRFRGDLAQARKVYEGVEPLTAEDVAEAMVWMASRPSHVCIDEMVIKPTDQASVHKIHRRV
ncbi:MAG: SDR family NAD(P)-dependent oxidoreductase [Verrucomicrobiota bacterium]|nr:SDR family NAD(P)-dependent oxidoreductase [Limisphaera sp.]MDW8382090.1 SDR family NAD(P)-dependent oxidoreductase [Verrucomicrobiota bacterium]